MPKQFNNAQQIYDYIHDEVKRTFNLALSRRDFIKLMSGGMVGAIATGLNTQRTNAQDNTSGDAQLVTTDTMPNGIASGDVTQSSVMLWTRSVALGTVRFEVLTDDDSPVTQLTADVSDPMMPVKVLVTDLADGTSYRYRVTDAEGNQLTGQFKTLPESGVGNLRFGVSGDWRGELRPYIAVSNAVERSLDFFVALGDTIYADHPSIDFSGEQARSLDDFRIKHNEVYSSRFGKNYWANLRAQMPIFSTIDDHEVTNDFAGGASPSRRFGDSSATYVNQTDLYNNGMQAYFEYNPLMDTRYDNTDDDRMEGRPKLYRYNTIGDTAALYILDARSFRDASVDSVGNFLNSAEIDQWRLDVWQAGRTMLGRTQVDDLKRDLLDAHIKGVVWKFVMIPEPLQQMGWLSGEDRWEGYAPERTEVLTFIEDNEISNVVFVSADIHSTFISDLTYQTEANGDLIPTHMWEISTGSVGYYPPTGQAAIEIANQLGVLFPFEADDYNNGDIFAKNAVLERVFDRFVIATQGLNPLGLDNTLIEHELLSGSWAMGHSFGWTEFDIDGETQVLTVTTYGVPSYSADDMSTNASALINSQPMIIGQMLIQPVL